MINKENRNSKRIIRHIRVREKVSGTESRPRLSVYRSNSHISAQVINDEKGLTIASCSSLDKEIAELIKGKNKSEVASIVGETVAKRAIKSKIKEVVFDRGGYAYTGRVASLAEGARSAGLKF